ncbi:MAG: CNNM family magnesium/cobalt transport protein CorC [Psychrosphaera sp.]|nr:CNNM family magnesium/cobalt transport protein CorC [Psychrosphaera sp.]
MSDEKSHSRNGSAKKKKSWFERILQLFPAELKNREQLVDVIQDAEMRELIDPQTKEMIEGVLEVSDMKVREIMIPRAQMITIDRDQTVEEVLPILLKSAHSRFPVINEDKDHVEGILLAKDLLPYAFDQEKEFTLKSILRKAIIVPEGKRVDSLLKEFREERYHMSIVVDEYGGVSGLVTIEDILEQIVGEIVDETDDSEPEDIRKVGKHVYTLQALTPVEDFNEHFAAAFDEDEADTIGGVILHAFGHMPARGESIELQGFNFKILNADSRRIQQIQLTTPKKTPKKEEVING